MNQHKFYAIRTTRGRLAEDPIYLDTETTGLTEQDQIIEIALIDSDGTTLLNTLVKPTILISAAATRVHNLENEDLLDAPRFDEILDELNRLTKNRLVLAYFTAFDLRLLAQSAAAWDVNLPYIHAKCMMITYSEFHGEWSDYRNKFTWQSQIAAARQLGLKVPHNLHRASADAELCRAIAIAVAETKLPGEHK